MKENLLAFVMAFLVCGELWAQPDYPGFRCYVEASGKASRVQALAASPVTGTTNMTILLCVEKGQSTELDAIEFVANLRDMIPEYFRKATFNNYQVNVVDILVKDNDGVTAHAFELAGTLVPYPPADESFVVPPWMVRDVLGQADAIYDFGNYDGDGDGEVDYLAFLVVRFAMGNSNGTTGLSIDDYYYTNDYKNGQQIKIDGNGYMTYAGKQAIIQRKKYPDVENVLSMAAHELGHSLFSLPDVEHSETTYFNHQSFGDFDPMSSEWGGFHQVASLYNPCFRLQKGWVTPTDASGTKTFSDFEATGQIYSCSLPSYSGALPSQKYYFSFYTRDPNNRWQANWPVPLLSDHINHAGVLVWRTVDGGYWDERKAMPITLESAHGKWIWDEDNPPDIHDINTGQADILNGLDSLQVRNSYIWLKYNPQTGERDVQKYLGSLYQRGSTSCFFDPEHCNTFAFYTNPSANEITSTSYSRAISPGFAMKNLRWESGQAKADFVSGTDAYTVTENATLTAGTWYISNTVTVASGVTLTINPGAVLRFPSANIRITVNGTLNVAGTASNPIIIDFTAPYTYGMNGISLNSGSSGSFSYCNIKNASYGINGSNATIAVDHCTVTNCAQAGVYSYGRLPGITNSTFTGNGTAISVSNSGFVSYPWITGNTISSNRYGIYLYNSSPMYLEFNSVSNNTDGGVWCFHGSTPYMRQNTITGNGGDGLHAEDGSPAHFGSYYGDPGFNVVRQNGRYGVHATSSNVFLGSTAQNGLNSIYGNGSYEVFATNSSNIPAQYDWWNVSTYPYFNWTRDFRVENGASINPYPALNWDPNSGRQTATASLTSVYTTQRTLSPDLTAGAPDSMIADTTFFDSELAAAMNELLQGKRDKAIRLFEKKFKKEKDNRKKTYILQQLAECYRTVDTISGGRLSSAGKFIGFLEKEVCSKVDRSDPLQAKALELESIFLLDQETPEKAVETLITLKDNHADPGIQRNALFNLAYIEQNILKNPVEGRKYFAQLKKSYPDDELTRIGEFVLVDLWDQSPDANVAARGEEAMTVNLDSVNAGLGNYPNPFNPTTVISYTIPKDGMVTLIVYDVLGREVETLVNRQRTVGSYEVSFDGSRLASGIYFYRLVSGNQVITKKMLLMK